jgi:Ser/Thr protein kinase RdoA (MazF antagonist)
MRSLWHLAARECESREVATAREWVVTIGDEPHVIWATPAADRSLLIGAAHAAEALNAVGVGVGHIVRTPAGALTASCHLDEHGAVELALRREPPGRPLDGSDPLDQQWWGDMLGRAHRELQRFGHPTIGRLIWPSDPELADVVAAVRRLTVTDRLTYGILHGEPHPELFRIDADTGRTSIARWGAPAIGPLLYDVAVAVCWAGGEEWAGEFLDGYLSSGPVARDELDSALPAMMDLAWRARRYPPPGRLPG